jgi:hypothetical protein
VAATVGLSACGTTTASRTTSAAAGAAIGSLSGNAGKGALIGAGVGAAVGAAIATEGNSSRHEADRDETVSVVVVDLGHPGRHCPPGQAKKGRC